jgi:DNA-binding MarR family transcriptional regulator
MHLSWALARVAKAFLTNPAQDGHDLARRTSLKRPVVDGLLTRMVIEGWLETADGWTFELTPVGHRELRTVLTKMEAFNRQTRRAS